MAARKKPNVRLRISPRSNPACCPKSESNVLLSKFISDNMQSDSQYTNDRNPFSNLESNDKDLSVSLSCSKLHEPSQNLKIAVIGSSKIGKTTLIDQLVYCNPLNKSKHPKGVNKPMFHYPLVIFNEHVYNVTLIDCPFLEQFPTDSLQDWTLCGGCNLREASGFILMFDITSESSFQYIKSIREQIIDLNIEAPIVIAANKVDLMATNGNFLRNNKREISAIMKKHWKGSVLIECSTKFNWRVLTVFKELIRMIDSKDNNTKQTAARAVHNVLRRNQCYVM